VGSGNPESLKPPISFSVFDFFKDADKGAGDFFAFSCVSGLGFFVFITHDVGDFQPFEKEFSFE